MADDRVAAAVEELYAADPAAFTARRGELAAAARSAGDRAAARAIAALRKPTRTAWVVNRLARTDPGAPAKLAELAAALTAAGQARHGPRLRELSAARGPLIDALTGQALTAAGLPDPPQALRSEVAATLTAALADPAVLADFAAGRLTSAVQWAGFGMAAGPDTGALDADDEEAGGAGPGRGAGAGTDRGTGGSDAAGPIATVIPLRRARPPRPATRTGRTATPGPAAAPAQRTGEDAERRAAAGAERRAREAAERAARERAHYEDAERTVAATSAAAAEAASAEDRLEAVVRDLEERLTRARDDLAAARLRARRAEAAERRARQVLQLMRPPE